MKIRTKAALFDKIAADRVWRIREISFFRSQCVNPATPVDAIGALRRAFVPLVYAHWEGFVTNTSQYYLEYIAMQRLRVGDLSLPIMSLYLWNRFSAQLRVGKHHALIDTCELVTENQSERVQRQHMEGLPKRANLNSKTLRELCLALGLPFTSFETKAGFIDAGLVGKRNNIAHGEWQEVDQSELDTLKVEVVMLIDLFRNEVENAATSETFKKAAA